MPFLVEKSSVINLNRDCEFVFDVDNNNFTREHLLQFISLSYNQCSVKMHLDICCHLIFFLFSLQLSNLGASASEANAGGPAVFCPML